MFTKPGLGCGFLLSFALLAGALPQAPTSAPQPESTPPPESPVVPGPDPLAGPPDANYTTIEIWVDAPPIGIKDATCEVTRPRRRQTVSYWVDSLGNAIINGDQLYGTEEEILAAAVDPGEGDDDIIRRSVSFSPVDGRRWPGGRVSYRFDPSITDVARQLFLDGAEAWTNRLPFLRFVEEDTPESRTILSIPGGWSYSHLGCCGGQLALGEFANLRTSIHEIGHTLGLHHEHQRPDRHLFLDIDTTQVPPGAASNWEALNPDEWSFTGSYDTNSVMHYYPQAGSVGGGDVLIPKFGVVIPRGGITFPSHTDVHHCCELYWEDCHNICGDGLFAPGYGEECDDGNNISGDGCSANCMHEEPECAPTCNPHEWPSAGCGLRASCTPFNPFDSHPNSGNTYCMCQAGYRASGLPPDAPEQYRVTWDNALGGQSHRVFVRPGQDCDQLCNETGANACSEVPLKDSCR